MSSPATKGQSVPQEIIDLRFDDEAGQIRVHFPDKHIQVMAVEAAVRACGAFRDQIEFANQFDDLLGHLAKWSRTHQPHVAESFLTTRDGGLLFLVIWSQAGFDGNLEDELTDLDVGVANNHAYGLVRMSVLGLPPCSKDSLSSFLSQDTQIRLWKNGD